jgi:hypothetical protein
MKCSVAIRDLVESVTVFRDTTRAGGVLVEISGRLTAVLGEQAHPNRLHGAWGKMVAEARYRMLPRPENDTIFSLEFGALGGSDGVRKGFPTVKAAAGSRGGRRVRATSEPIVSTEGSSWRGSRPPSKLPARSRTMSQ